MRTAARYCAGAFAALTLCATAQAEPLKVGGKNFTEQLLLSNMTAQYLRAKGYEVDLKNGLGTVVMRQALEGKQLDVVWDYTGTALIVYNRIKQKMEPKQAYEKVKALDAPRGLTWLDASPLNNTYAIAMKADRAKADDVHTLSQLAAKLGSDAKVKDYTLAVDMEFAGRPDGLRGMQKTYGFRLSRAKVRQMDPGLVYNAVRDGQAELGLVYASDGRIKGFDLVTLTDDKGFFPAYNATPVVRAEVLAAHPQLAAQLNQLAAKLSTEAMRDMNAKVDIEHQPVDKVAHAFLSAQGLL
nr:glycine betaine ABC transporter substrate-binding protein [Chitinasiproducens palmae]